MPFSPLWCHVAMMGGSGWDGPAGSVLPRDVGGGRGEGSSGDSLSNQSPGAAMQHRRDVWLASARLLGPSPPSSRSPTQNLLPQNLLLTFLPVTPCFRIFCARAVFKSQPHLRQFLLLGSLNPWPMPPITSSGQPITSQES